jgi:hypothetical protein
MLGGAGDGPVVANVGTSAAAAGVGDTGAVAGEGGGAGRPVETIDELYNSAALAYPIFHRLLTDVVTATGDENARIIFSPNWVRFTLLLEP